MDMQHTSLSSTYSLAKQILEGLVKYKQNWVNEWLEQKEYALDLFKNKSLPSTAKQDKNQVIENIDRIRLRVIKVIREALGLL